MANIKTIRFINRKEIDLVKYNNLISKSKNISIYCYAWYLDAVSDNWGVLIQGDYDVVLPIPFTIKFGLNIIYQPYFTREITLFYDSKKEEPCLSDFINALPKKFKQIDFNISIKESIKDYKIKETQHQELNLDKPYEEVYKDYSKNTKRLIKKAKKQDCIITKTTDTEPFILFFKQNTGKQVDYTNSHYNNLNKLTKLALEHQKGVLYQVLVENRTVAYGYYLLQDHRITYLKGSATEEGKKIGAMFLLMNTVIEENCHQSKVFDFGGSKIESIAQFYAKFGAKNRNYYSYSKNEHSWLIKKGKNIRDFLKK